MITHSRNRIALPRGQLRIPRNHCRSVAVRLMSAPETDSTYWRNRMVLMVKIRQSVATAHELSDGTR
jgi:hypothetical protein